MSHLTRAFTSSRTLFALKSMGYVLPAFPVSGFGAAQSTPPAGRLTVVNFDPINKLK